MSHIIRAFTTINTLLDSTLGNVAPLGELSPYSRTFSTSKTDIADTLYESVSLTVFNCAEDGINAPMPVGSDTFLLNLMEDIVTNWDDTLDFTDQMTTRHPSVNIEIVGASILYDGVTLPGYIQFSDTINGEPINFMIWLSDAVFRDGYDLYEIRVVPPIPNVGDLDTDSVTLLQILADYEVSEQIAAQEAIRNNDPSTKTATLKLKWVDRVSGVSMTLTWVLVTFGDKGLIYENQLEAIRQYLLEMTGIIPEEWVANFPDLIISITLTIIPLWHKVALRSSGSLQYVHSPLITVQEISSTLIRRYPLGATTTQLSEATFTVMAYKSIGFLAFPEPNSGENAMFGDLYPDYAMIPINDINLNRLSSTTRAAIQALELGVRVAEMDDGVAVIPSNMSRVLEANRTYITYTVDGIKHRIMSRASFYN